MVKKIILFGGTFDPPHIEHVKMAERASEQFDPDLFVVMPTAYPPHKTVVYGEDGKNRFEMCKIAFGGIKNLVVDDYELKKGGRSYSFETVRHIAEKYDGARIIFLMGTDMLSTFSEWKNPEEILKYCVPALCQREGEGEKAEKTALDFEKKFGKKAYICDYIGKNLSSSEYKFSKMSGLETKGFLTEETRKYIEENDLYKSDVYFEFIKNNLKKSRIEHTVGVILEAVRLAKRLKADLGKTILAATLHDCAKYLRGEDFDGFERDKNTPEPVVHQYLGAFVAEKVLGVTDEEVLDAIRYHTTGKPDMTLLGKIIFVADMIERGRTYPEVYELRSAVDEDFESGFVLCLKRSVEFIKIKGQKIDALSEKALCYYQKENKNGIE
ncbi:MAG: nicotinate (nicotinamide) nucleotide adenylyltransferase [Clostridia bacterium]|nr:nicotinate (nicotinamide) nucleotide adenylyltransferase [Clostridia bacterium]